MTKQAETDHPVHEIITSRWSPRSFADRPVARNDVLSMLEAARWAASCFNEQPWRFIVGTTESKETHSKIAECLVEKNRQWAAKAPVLMISVARTSFTRNDKPNRHAWHDVGLAVGNLSAQATAMGLSLHQMAGFSADHARESFEIPEGFEPVAVIAIGYRGEPSDLPESFQEGETAPRSRRPVSEFMVEGSWPES